MQKILEYAFASHIILIIQENIYAENVIIRVILAQVLVLIYA